MAYYEGIANSYADLLAALTSGLAANGWESAGSSWHADGCAVELAEVGTTLTLRGGAGVNPEGALIQAGPAVVRVGTAGAIPPLTFPCTYHLAIHADPREVYFHINYDVDRWQWLAFGKSSIALPGSGCWYAATLPGVNQDGIAIRPFGGGNSFRMGSGALFWGGGVLDDFRNGFVNASLDGVQWVRSDGNSDTNLTNNNAALAAPLRHLIDRQPSAFNASAVLLPAQVWMGRAGNTATLVADFSHCRVMRIDNHAPGTVIEYGSDRWRVYPFIRRNVAARDGGVWAANVVQEAHSGTMGIAVRHDGP